MSSKNYVNDGIVIILDLTQFNIYSRIKFKFYPSFYKDSVNSSTGVTSL